jgi:hypothetical protein
MDQLVDSIKANVRIQVEESGQVLILKIEQTRQEFFLICCTVADSHTVQ